MKANVFVTLKPDVLDPQGEAVRGAMESLGFAATSVRVGKLIEIELPAAMDRKEADGKLRTICDKLLANTVIEDFRFEIV